MENVIIRERKYNQAVDINNQNLSKLPKVSTPCAIQGKMESLGSKHWKENIYKLEGKRKF